jgi:hypothetical protein
MEFACVECGSSNIKRFNAEANIHFAVERELTQASVFAFPRLLICLECGLMQGTLSESELRSLRKGSPVSSRSAAA